MLTIKIFCIVATSLLHNGQKYWKPMFSKVRVHQHIKNEVPESFIAHIQGEADQKLNFVKMIFAQYF